MANREILIQASLMVNRERWSGAVDSRSTLLDTLRDDIGVMSVKKGCDHGQCGACTVLVHGRRIVSCLAFTGSYPGAEVTTAEGLGSAEELSPLQEAFVDFDGLQCGYCTPGQICSAVGMFDEAIQGMPSHTTDDVSVFEVELSDEEIRERMSGNLCRCGAYMNIVDALAEIARADGLRP